MPRVKRGKTHVKKRRKLIKQVKGYKGGRKKLIKQAKTASTKAGAFAYRDRKTRKRIARRVWQIKINAAARENNLSYSKLINLLKENKVEIDRKILADLAEKDPKTFAKIIKEISK